MIRRPRFPHLVPLLLLAACGTYSTLRPARVLAPGHVELQGGVAANGFGEVLPVGDLRVGVFDRVELGAHYEVYTGFFEARVQLLDDQEQPVSLAIGAGGGFGTTFLDEVGESSSDNENADGAAFFSLVVSRRFGDFEPYFADRSAALFGKGFVTAPVGGVCIYVARWLTFTLEGGAAIHFRAGTALGLAQGAVGLGLRF